MASPVLLSARPGFSSGELWKCCNSISTRSITQVAFGGLVCEPLLIPCPTMHWLPASPLPSTPTLAPKREQSFPTSEVGIHGIYGKHIWHSQILKEKALRFQCPSYASRPALTVTGQQRCQLFADSPAPLHVSLLKHHLLSREKKNQPQNIHKQKKREKRRNASADLNYSQAKPSTASHHTCKRSLLSWLILGRFVFFSVGFGLVCCYFLGVFCFLVLGFF